MTFAKFVWKNGLRNKKRAALTILSIALAVFVMVTLFTFINELDRRLEETSAARLVTHHAVIWIFPIPERYRAQIESVPGVVAVTPLTYFGGVYIDRAHTDFAQFSCDPAALFEVFPEISLPEDQKQTFLRERNSAIVGRRQAEKHGWKLGDRIALQGAVMPVDIDLTVRGIFSGSANDEANIYFHQGYLNEIIEGGFGEVSTFYVRVASPELVAGVGQQIDAMFQNSETATRTETEKAFQMGFVSMLGNIKLLIAAISGLIIFTILLVTGNTMAMAVRERVREIAVLKTLGFRRRKLLGLLVSEGVVISLTGGLLGCLAAELTFKMVDVAAYTQGRLQHFDVTWGVVAVGLLISALVGLISTSIPAYHASSRTIAEAIRSV